MSRERLDINLASVDELEGLVGVGETKALAIVDYRAENGRFNSLRDLLSVPGIGPSFLDMNKPFLACETAISPRRGTRSSTVVQLDMQECTTSKSCSPSKIGTTSQGIGINNDIVNRSPETKYEIEQSSDTMDEDDLSNDYDEYDNSSIFEKTRFYSSQLTKRKSDRGTDGLSPGRKQCKLTNGYQHGGKSSNGFLGVLKTAHASSRITPLRRLTSRNNPPPELAPWLSKFKAWSHTERLVALDELVELCEPTQIRHIMSAIEPQFQRDFISLLPKELALYVLSFLNARDLCRAAQACRYWHVLVEDNLLWREKCRDEGLCESLVFSSRLRRTRVSSGSKEYVTSKESPWRSLYRCQYNVERNWRSQPIPEPKVLKGHEDHVITCLEFCGNRIVSGSDDNTLKVWSATSSKCMRTLTGHSGGVWSSQMRGNIIISGSTDRTLRVWNADTGQCLHSLHGHTSTVRCMHLHKQQVVSGSRDATLRMWDIDTGACVHTFTGHVAAVRCVQYDGRRVVSGAYDYVVKVWDATSETCIHTLQGHTNRFDGVHIVSGSLDTSIRVWDVETGNCQHTLTGHQSLTSGMELKDNILVSGNADSTVKVWDILSGECLQTLQGSNKHQSAVTCLQFNKKFVITSSDDGTVKLWDLKSGEFLRNLVTLDSGGSGGVVWRIKASNARLVAAVGSRNGTEETKLMVIDFSHGNEQELVEEEMARRVTRSSTHSTREQTAQSIST